MVYRSPGAHRTGGTAYAFLGVDDAAGLKAALADGWHLTLPEALGGVSEAPASRDELEQKAKELGVGFNSRTTDATLSQRIAEAL